MDGSRCDVPASSTEATLLEHYQCINIINKHFCTASRSTTAIAWSSRCAVSRVEIMHSTHHHTLSLLISCGGELDPIRFIAEAAYGHMMVYG